jgi:hypothetical protein
MSRIIRIDHVAIVVNDIPAALDFWRTALAGGHPRRGRS